MGKYKGRGDEIEMSFPLCAEVLIYVFGGLELNETQRDDWTETVQEYREKTDCMKLITTIARQLNFWARKGNTIYVHDTCPPEKLNLIMSLDGKNGQIPITRAVWLIYLELEARGMTFEFTENILPSMEERLAQEHDTKFRPGFSELGKRNFDKVQLLLCELLEVVTAT